MEVVSAFSSKSNFFSKTTNLGIVEILCIGKRRRVLTVVSDGGVWNVWCDEKCAEMIAMCLLLEKALDAIDQLQVV